MRRTAPLQPADPGRQPGGERARHRCGRRARIAAAALATALATGTAFTSSAVSAETAPPLDLGPSAWSHFGDPRAVHRDGRTFVGWTDPTGFTHVATVAGRVLEHRRLGPRLVVDDHNNPSLHVRADGRITVFYSQHNGPRMYVRTTGTPLSFAELSPPASLPTNTSGRWGYTYPNPMRIGGRLWLLFRGGDWQPAYSIEQNGGWTTARRLVRGPRGLRRNPSGLHRPYAKYASDGRTLHAAFTEGNSREFANSIYYAAIRDGWFRAADGRRLARFGDAPPVTVLEPVVRFREGNQWPLDTALDASERPVILYHRASSSGSGYWYARWDGERWRRSLIAELARSDSRAGATLDHEDPATVYLSRRPRSGVRSEVETWRTQDGGRTWSAEPLTANSALDNLRPVSPRGLPGSGGVIWLYGTRESYTRFSTNALTAGLP